MNAEQPASQELAKVPPAPVQPKTPMAVGNRGIEIRDFDGLWRFAVAVAKSGLAPKTIETPEAVFVAVQMGLEIGLTPMAALQNIAVINGRPSLWGDAQLAIVRSSGMLETFDEWYESGGKRMDRNPTNFTDDVAGVCMVKRIGYQAQTSAFSVADAKRAALWGKQGPWTQYPARQLRFRARGYVLRDNFGDALKGLLTDDEARELPPVTVTATAVARQEPASLVQIADSSPQTQEQPAAAQEAVKLEVLPKATPQKELADVVIAAGFGFEQLRVWGKESGNLPDADSIPDFDSIPLDVAKRLLRSKVGLLKGLADVKGAAQ
jgi:hypothetical protein